MKKKNTDMPRRRRLGDVKKVFKHRWGAVCPKDDEGAREDLQVLLYQHALHPTHASERVQNTLEVMAPWMSDEEMEATRCDIVGLDRRHLWLCPNELRHKMRLTTALWEELEVWHIPPFDMTAKQLAKYRRKRRLKLQTLKRRKAGVKPRVKPRKGSRPWEKAGCSKATWYRRLKCRSETEVKLDHVSAKPTATPDTLRETEVKPAYFLTLRASLGSHPRIETGSNDNEGTEKGRKHG